MRYAVVSAAVFGSALFLAPSGHASSVSKNQPLPSILNVPASSITVQPAVARKAPAKAKLADQPVQPAQPQPVMITVSTGDTVSALADANGTSVDRLYAANTSLADPNLIVPGQQLRVPAAEEQLPDRPLPAPQPVAVAVEQPVAAPVKTTTPTVSAATIASGSVWDQLAACESGGNWSINTGNGYYGGLQFTIATWQAMGGSGLPSDNSREQQIAIASALQARSGWGQWPACSSKLGLL